MKAIERTLELRDGRRLRSYDTGPSGAADELTVMWHHGTPNIGLPPEPLFPASERLGIRWIGYDRPGYGGSTRRLDRDVASAATDVAAVMDDLGIERFAVMGHSGGGPHALACAALLSDRVSAAVLGSSLAPFGAEGLDYFAGMIASGIAALSSRRGGSRGEDPLRDIRRRVRPRVHVRRSCRARGSVALVRQCRWTSGRGRT
jgi:pimeloyl-ACP methyl ester carboxylesterase